MVKDEYGNLIYELKNDEKDIICEYNKIYMDLYGFIDGVLDSINNEPIIEDYKLSIYSIVYRIKELLDTLRVMMENSFINSGFVVIRSLVEISAQLCYIISDDSQIIKRATILQMFDIKAIARNEELLYTYMSELECYKDYVNFIKDKKYQTWYSYSEGKNISIKSLFAMIGWEDIYEDIYRPLCSETHQINHMDLNIEPANGLFNFKPFRSFENHNRFMTTILKVVQLLFPKVINKYGNDDLNDEWNKYEIKLSKYIQEMETTLLVEKHMQFVNDRNKLLEYVL